MKIHRWLLLTVWLALTASTGAQSRTQASLLLSSEAARPGDTVTAAVRLKMDAGWHTYWRNPGESGLATTIEWTLPAGVAAGEILWPPPEAYVAEGMTTYVHHDEALLLVPLKLAADLKPGRLELKAKVQWLECQIACVPGDADLKGVLEIANTARPSASASLIEAARQRLPVPAGSLEAQGRWENPPAGESATLIIEGKALDGFAPSNFYPYPNEQAEIAPAANVLTAEPGRFRLSKTVKRSGDPFPERIDGLLVLADAKGKPLKSHEISLALGAERTGPVVGAANRDGASAAGATAHNVSLLKMLGLAFLGGLILNIMPCVLPVIALKILGFVQQSREAPARVRKFGLMYALGVLVSFMVLAGLVIQVQLAGDAASWGMQMQNPYFRLALLLIVTLVALNLFGLFEITMPGAALGSAAGLASKEGMTGAFFSGVLATALATPCTAPFLAVALGFAFTQPPWVILIIFATVGVGLALPYVLLSWQPGWLRFVPKPGAWMLRFKVAMGFPMLATAVWLFDLTTPAFGPGAVLWLGLFLSVLALAVWVWGEFVQRGRQRRGVAMAVSLGLLLFNYLYVLEAQLQWRTPPTASADADIIKDSPEGIEWHRWSAAAVERARQEGHPVLVDFTAKWCLTCKRNKSAAIEIPAVREKLKSLNFRAFRADNTDRSPLIAAELKRFERAGVPLVLVFSKTVSQAPVVLPEWLTPALVLEALDNAAKPPG